MAITYRAYKPEKHHAKIMTDFLYGQERDHALHQMNRLRYLSILTTEPPGPFRERITTLLAETNSRIHEIESIILHSEGQLPSQAEIDQVLQEREANAGNAPARPN